MVSPAWLPPHMIDLPACRPVRGDAFTRLTWSLAPHPHTGASARPQSHYRPSRPQRPRGCCERYDLPL